MKWATSERRNRLYLISAAILVLGLLSAVFVYLRAGTDQDNAMLNEYEYSKRYQHDLELYGGKANIVATEITNWFNGLWHGKGLAYTIACITVLVSYGFFFAARHVPSETQSLPEKESDKHT